MRSIIIRIAILNLVGIFAVHAQDPSREESYKAKVIATLEEAKNDAGIEDLSFGSQQIGGTLSSKLNSLNMDAVPYLISYLGDETPIKTTRRDRTRVVGSTPFRFFIAAAINRITDHTFPTATADGHVTVKQVQEVVLAWWESHHHKTYSERKLEDINDPIHTNRFNSYYWAAREKVAEARPLLEKRIVALLAEREMNSLVEEEMAECAHSLGEIGNPDSLSYVEKVCEHLSSWEPQSTLSSYKLRQVFLAFHALSQLGRKGEALVRLDQLLEKTRDRLEQDTLDQFLKEIAKANDW